MTTTITAAKNHHFSKYFFSLLLLVSSISSMAQGEANVWYFGNGAGLDFNYTPPVQLENGNAALGASNYEGVGSMSDANGNLLFYTDGRSVFNKNHVTMTSGTGLLGGDGSSSQSGLCLPVNGSSSLYFIFSTDNGTSKSYYSIVDMTMSAGLGDVSTKNSALVAASCAEAILAVPEYDGAGISTGESWIIFHESSSNIYHEYKTSGSSVNFVSTYSVGFAVPGQKAILLKTNGCFDKIAFSIYNSGRVEVLPFNNTTGVISAPSLILNGTGAGNAFLNVEVFGVEFSPNEQFLYVTESGLNNRKTVFQFDISSGTGTNPAAVLASRSYFTGDGTVDRFGHLQLAPDGKIYCPAFTFSLPSYMSVIPSPNTAWTQPTPTSTEFEFKKFTYNVKRVGEGLPIFSQNLLRQIKIFYNNACEGSSTNFSYVFGGSAVSLSWDFGDPGSGASNTSTSASPSHVYSTAGTYTVNLSIVDNCGRTRTGSVSVIVKSGPTVSIPATRCVNQNIVVTGTGTNAANYVWSQNADMSSPTGPATTYTYNGTLPKTIYVEDPTPLASYTSGNTSAAATAGADVGYTYFELFTSAEITSFQVTSRTSGTVSFSIQSESGATTYWGPTAYSDVAGTASTIPVNVTLAAGRYRFYTTDKNKCYRNNTSADGGRDVAGVIDVLGEKNGTKGGSFFNIAFDLPDPCGVRAYSLTESCCVPPVITTQPSAQSNICVGSNASFTVATSAGAPTYQWYVSTNGGGTFTAIVGATSATYTFAVTAANNNYQYRAEITSGGCTNTSNAATLTVATIPNITSAATGSICSGTALNYDITSNVAAAYSWDRAAVAGISNVAAMAQSADPITEILYNTTGAAVDVTYIITPTSTAGSCVGASFNYVVNVKPKPNLAIANAAICAGDAAHVFDAGAGYTIYAWSGNGTGAAQTTSGTTAGTYTAIVTDANGCKDTASATLTVNAKPNITVANAAICAGDAAHVFDAGAGYTTYAWSGNGTGAAQTTSGTTAGAYTVRVVDANTCKDTATATLTVNAKPNITVANAAICAGDAAHVFDAGAGYTTYAWSVNGTGAAQTTSGTNTVVLQNQYGCVRTDSVTIGEDCPSSLFIPNAFTPNNDEVNDVFAVKKENIYDFEMWVFDRWGEIIYHSTDANEGWNGKRQNFMQDAQIDVYVWKISYKHWKDWKDGGSAKQQIGHVTLLR